MDPQLLKHLAMGVMIPVVVCALVVGVGWRGARGRWAIPAGLAGGYVLTHAWLLGGLVEPRSAADWLPYVAIAAGLVGLLESLGTGRAGNGAAGAGTSERAGSHASGAAAWWAVRGVVLIASAYATLRGPIHQGEWAAWVSVAWVLGFAAVGLACWWAGERVAERDGGAGAAWGLTALSGGTGLVMIVGYYSMRLGQAGGAVAAGLMVVTLLACWRGRVLAGGLVGGLGRGAAAVPTVMSLTLLLNAVHFGQAERLGMVYPGLLALAMPAGLLADVGPWGRWTGWRKQAARAALASVPVIAAVGLAAAGYRPPEPYEG